MRGVGTFLCFVLGGCGCNPLSPFPDPDPDPETDAGPQTFECFAAPYAFEPDLLVAAHDVLRPFEDGTTDLPLSASGCLRVKRTVTGGQLESLVLELNLGPPFDPDRLQYGTDQVVVLARVDRSADGTLVTRVDGDPDPDSADDDFFEWEETVEPARGRIERVERNPASREILARQVIERQTDGTYIQADEALVEGVLTEVTRFAVTDESFQQPGGGGECTQTECTAEQQSAIEDAERQALRSFTDCFLRGTTPGNERRKKATQLVLAWKAAHSYTCVANCRNVGQWDLDAQAEGGTLHMDIDPSGEGVINTMIHEWTHGVVGGHASDTLPLIRDAARGDTIAERMRDSVDPSYACEAYCSGTRCTCARCLGVRACDPPCNGLPSCVERDELNLFYISSEAAGAACDPLIGDATWHQSLAECESECSFGGSCTSYSLSCDPNCK